MPREIRDAHPGELGMEHSAEGKMNAKELYEAGKLSAAIDQLNQEVRAAPTNAQKRIFLFELLCFYGDLERAERQLDALVQVLGDAKSEIGVQAYRNVLEAEKHRQKFFKQGGRPKFLVEAPLYADLHLQALQELRNGHPAESLVLLNQSERVRSQVHGRIGAAAFQNFRDADDLIAPFLEIIVGSDYGWLPFEHIKRIQMDAPKKLRDLMWIEAKIELHQGALGEVFLPVLYVASYEEPNESIKLGRLTEWKAKAEDLLIGVGQKTFLADDQEQPILGIREIEFD